MKRSLAHAAAVLLFACPVAALAHTGHADSGLVNGFAHPFLGLDHLLAMLVVGAWGALHAGRAWLAPLAFVAALSVGVVLGQQGLAVPQLDPLLALSVVVVGLMLARPADRSVAVPLALIGGFALLHGVAHGGELASGSSVLAGILLGSTTLHAIGVAFGRLVLDARPRLATRSGQLVALLGGGLVLSSVLA